MDGVHITLTKPVESFGKTFTTVTLKEPTGALYSRLGEPRIAVINQGAGSGYYVENAAIINQYLETLLDMDATDAAAVILQLSLTDTMKLRSALFLFFGEAAAAAAAKAEPKSAPKLQTSLFSVWVF